MQRLALCETDHARDTEDNRGCILCASDGAEILRTWARITSSVVATNLLMRWRNFGCAGKGSDNHYMQRIGKNNTRNNLGRHVSEQRTTAFLVVIVTG